MKLVVDENGMITAYCMVGDIPGSVEYDNIVPDDFEINFKPSFYMLQNEVIVENSDYVEPTDTPPDDGPTSVQQVVMQMSATITQMQQLIMAQGQEIAELKGANK
ncbi:DUF2977 domain-containing protein [Pediococcus pentosaceus]|uniref:DUF2977 domain-containing protein n=1 Tax=Pediococcus pentosaceus TaxID=1255 RepID=UPI001F58A6C7|nr:DUF2977 domain-containing protein [Pediococcus pentosaceus]MCI2961007.1 DUF2977 domain-containing protein [Pediococcus pentosaceus]